MVSSMDTSKETIMYNDNVPVAQVVGVEWESTAPPPPPNAPGPGDYHQGPQQTFHEQHSFNQQSSFGSQNSFRQEVPQHDYTATRQYLSQHGWPAGLQNSLINSCSKFPIRYFIVDDSGSMIQGDGHRLVQSKGSYVAVECSRWKELTDALKFHAQLADIAQAPTEFRLLNGAPPIVVGRGNDGGESLQLLNTIFDQPPGGGTPLCRHIREVVAQITPMAQQLRANAQKAVVVVATDGESSDGDIAAAMRPLQDLPVWVVVRLCTDDDKVVEYWNNIDGQLELDMDVLDDLFGEAAEVTQENNWLTYGEPLHRLREWGVHIREMDLIDEAKLTPDQMRVVCAMVLSIDLERSELPHPVSNWSSFYHMVSNATASAPLVWCPMTRRMQRWIRLTKLRNRYSGSSCSIM